MEDIKKINPWESFEVKDYDKLSKDFGIESFSNILKKVPNPHLYMRRGFIFGHKDFNKIIEAINKKQDFAMLTGLMPSGKFHLGHKTIADQMIYYQELGAECYITIADIEAYLTRNLTHKEMYETAVNEYLINYIALGLKPKKTHVYFQSEGSKDYMNLSKYVSKKITLNEMKAIYGDLNPGKIISVFTQIADILHPQLEENGGPKPVIVPIGIDQLPHANLSRDIASRMSDEYKFILPSFTFNKFIPSLQGGKMSSSIKESYIALTDNPKEVENKIKKYAFSGGRETIEEHRKKGGNPDVDVSYQYLTFFEKDDKKLKQIYDDYKSGKILTSELKQITIDTINTFLKEHQKNREKARSQIDKFIYKK